MINLKPRGSWCHVHLWTPLCSSWTNWNQHRSAATKHFVGSGQGGLTRPPPHPRLFKVSLSLPTWALKFLPEPLPGTLRRPGTLHCSLPPPHHKVTLQVSTARGHFQGPGPPRLRASTVRMHPPLWRHLQVVSRPYLGLGKLPIQLFDCQTKPLPPPAAMESAHSNKSSAHFVCSVFFHFKKSNK